MVCVCVRDWCSQSSETTVGVDRRPESSGPASIVWMPSMLHNIHTQTQTDRQCVQNDRYKQFKLQTWWELPRRSCEPHTHSCYGTHFQMNYSWYVWDTCTSNATALTRKLLSISIKKFVCRHIYLDRLVGWFVGCLIGRIGHCPIGVWQTTWSISHTHMVPMSVISRNNARKWFRIE